MAPTGEQNQIIRVWHVRNAPTGESERYLRADGTVWKPVLGGFRPPDTGGKNAIKSNNQIREIY